MTGVIEIKIPEFRGKRVDNGEFIYGLLLKADVLEDDKYVDHYFIIEEANWDSSMCSDVLSAFGKEVDPKTIEQVDFLA